MILPDWKIKFEVDRGRLIKSPIEELQIQPASVDLRLGNDFRRICPNSCKRDFNCDHQPYTFSMGEFSYSHQTCKNGYLDVGEEVGYLKAGCGQPIIGPGEFILGTTVETVSLPDDVGAMVSGRSSIGRTGLVVENAGWVDPGFEGKITLELLNTTNYSYKLPVGMRICQIIFFQLSAPARRSYGRKSLGSKYQGQNTTQGSLIYQETKDA